MRVLGLINARGGSKGIPSKNVKLLGGKPLIAYAIEAALAAERIDRVVVSTDDPRIAEVARDFGAETPFLRPHDLATDTALQIDAIKHALETLIAAGDHFDVVAVLQPTCPLRSPQDVDGALLLMEGSGADTVISVIKVVSNHPLTMYTEETDGWLRPLQDSAPAGVSRQQFSTLWQRNGAVYAVRVPIVLERRSLYGGRVAGYPMPPERAVNIDEPFDWIVAEAMIEHVKQDKDARGSGAE